MIQLREISFRFLIGSIIEKYAERSFDLHDDSQDRKQSLAGIKYAKNERSIIKSISKH